MTAPASTASSARQKRGLRTADGQLAARARERLVRGLDRRRLGERRDVDRPSGGAGAALSA
jgi:hypothetical protein